MVQTCQIDKYSLLPNKRPPRLLIFGNPPPPTPTPFLFHPHPPHTPTHHHHHHHHPPTPPRLLICGRSESEMFTTKMFKNACGDHEM